MAKEGSYDYAKLGKAMARKANALFKKDLLDWGFQKSTADPCLFTKRKEGAFLQVLLFVDDLAIANK